MTTRNAKNPASFHQHSFASSSEFERGLLGNLVARRTALLDSREDRELIWALQYFSHQDGGLAAVARDLISRFPDQIGTQAMLTAGKSAGQNYNADEVRAIRLELAANLRHKFPLKGETAASVRELRTKFTRFASAAEKARALRAATDENIYRFATTDDFLTDRHAKEQNAERIAAAKHPAVYPVAALLDLCLSAAREGIAAWDDYPATSSLERTLAEMCLDPAWNFETGCPWYFAGLAQTLREYVSQWTAEKCQWPETKLGKIIADEFDYTWQSRCMSLLTGEARRGKSFATKMCCLKNPGRARFVEVPPGNDDTSFFRALARGLGLGNLGQYSTVDVRDRVETMLLTGDILLVLDESQRLFPERTRYSYPCRITWLMTMANAKVPILMIATPQFTDRQKIAEKGGWNSAQLTGRIFNYKELPAALDDADLMAVCQAVLPEADKKVLIVLATYARTSARYLSAVESIALRARYLAGRAGRKQCSTDDVRTAMNESVIPSDTALNSVLEKARAQSPRTKLPQPARQNFALHQENLEPQPDRNASRAGRRENLTEFATA